jgi:hypothetical protein
MAKVFDIAGLEQRLTDDFGWRRKELVDIVTQLNLHEGDVIEPIYLRAAVLLIYAHWEGYIKCAIGCYLDYVVKQGHKWNKLRSGLIAAATKNRIEGFPADTLSERIELVRDFLERPDKFSLSSGVNEEIAGQGILDVEFYSKIVAYLEASDFMPKIDDFKLDELIDARNYVAHGRKTKISVGDIGKANMKVIDLMERIRDGVINMAKSKHFVKAK